MLVDRTYQLSLRGLQSLLRLTLPRQFPCRAEKSEMSSRHCSFVEKRELTQIRLDRKYNPRAASYTSHIQGTVNSEEAISSAII